MLASSLVEKMLTIPTKLVTYISDFPLWENKIAYLRQKILLNVSNSVLPEWEIKEMCY